MPFNPLVTSENIRETFRRYILSTFRTNSDSYNNQLAEILSRDKTIVRGPYLQISHNFPKGKTIDNLVDEGILSTEFRNLGYKPFEERRLYAHQESAIRKIVSGRNVVVSTGTGSGKTESFLIPILNSLMREKEAGALSSGVRVMLLYPMNALANDQMERMRDILRNYPSITFGTFTGETEETRDKADSKDAGLVQRIPNEIYDRTTFRKSPPHILITNYSMLEHLLIKPENNVLFGNTGNNHWRYVVLDEAHTYTGAKGSEVSILLRRLKTVLGKPDLRFIITSATLGSPDEDEEVAHFASRLCSTDFDESDVIRSEYIPMDPPSDMKDPGDEFYVKVAELVSQPGTDVEKGLSKILTNLGLAECNPREALYEIINADPVVHRLAGLLDDGPMTVDELSEASGLSEVRIFNTITAVSATKKYGDRVFNAKYHLFVRGLDGAYVTLRGSDKLFIRPQKMFKEDTGLDFKVFQISTCYNCNAIYILGTVNNSYLEQVSKHSSDYKGSEPYLLLNGQELDPDYLEDASNDRYTLCSRCGSIQKGNNPGCSCGPEYSNAVIRVSDKEKVCTCPVCGNRDSRRGLLRQLYLGNDASTAVIASALFKDLIDSRDSRFLAFSDNRQSAAFFASYMEDTYTGILMKRVIYETIQGNVEKLSKGVSFAEFLELVRKTSESSGNLLSEAECLEAVVRECAQNNSYRSLEYQGFLRFEYGYNESGSEWHSKPMENYGLTEDDVYNLFNSLAKFVRDRRAVDVDSTDFKPYEYRRGFSLDGGKGIARLYNDSVRGYLENFMDSDKARDFAKKFLDSCLRFDSRTSSSFLDLKRLRVAFPDRVYHCTRCRGSFPFSTRGICIKCNSETLIPYDVNAVERKIGGIDAPANLDTSNHYVRTVIDSPLRRFKIKEHTAQLSRTTARNYQSLFRDGKLDALSCSTTFEMGVDIGTLNSVFMRNVPPSPSNYVQRAGRAGRGEDSSAFALTFCREASHDLTYFDDPCNMIDGKIGVPKIKPENPAVVIRHVFATAFNFFWKMNGGYPSSAKNLVNQYDNFKEYLESKPQDLKKFLLSIVPEQIRDKENGIDVSDFGWIQEMFRESGDESIGRFFEAVGQYKTDSKVLGTTGDVAADKSSKGQLDTSQKLGSMISSLISSKGSMEALERTDTLDFLSRHNLIPKYGFPADVVPMLPASGSSDDDLSRNLRIAITEFAPGSEVIVNGRKVRSQYITPIRRGHWIQYRYKRCGGCGKVTTLIDNYLEDQDDSNITKLSTCSCGQSLESIPIKRFIRPDNGFKYVDTKMSVTEKPKHPSSSGISFCDSYDPFDSIRTFGKERVQIISKSNSRLVAVNETQYLVCNRCGYVITMDKMGKIKSFEHKRPDNTLCTNTNFGKAIGLGCTFNTDSVVIRFLSKPCCDTSTAVSVLYAIIEGFCREFAVERNEIGGCLDNIDGNYSIVLFDNTPGGSGYVKVLGKDKNFVKTINAAISVVKNCTCGGEDGDTSCYSCLRNYNNQMFHEILVRGMACDYLEALDLGE